MNIEQLDTSRIFVSLCDSELQEHSLSFESLDMRTPEGKEFFRTLLCSAEKKTGVKLIGRKIRIEALKYTAGCMLLITVRQRSNGRRYRIKSRSGFYTFRFDSADDLISCLECTRLPSYILTEENGIYRIIIPHAMPGRNYMRILSEFSAEYRRSDIYAFSVLEHTRIIARS